MAVLSLWTDGRIDPAQDVVLPFRIQQLLASSPDRPRRLRVGSRSVFGHRELQQRVYNPRLYLSVPLTSLRPHLPCEFPVGELQRRLSVQCRIRLRHLRRRHHELPDNEPVLHRRLLYSVRVDEKELHL